MEERLTPNDTVFTCRSCGLSGVVRELGLERRAPWSIVTCPRCGGAIEPEEAGPERSTIDTQTVRRALRRQRVSMRELAQEMGCSPTRTSHIISGPAAPTDQQVLTISEKSGLTPQEIWRPEQGQAGGTKR